MLELEYYRDLPRMVTYRELSMENGFLLKLNFLKTTGLDIYLAWRRHDCEQVVNIQTKRFNELVINLVNKTTQKNNPMWSFWQDVWYKPDSNLGSALNLWKKHWKHEGLAYRRDLVLDLQLRALLTLQQLCPSSGSQTHSRRPLHPEPPLLMILLLTLWTVCWKPGKKWNTLLQGGKEHNHL